MSPARMRVMHTSRPGAALVQGERAVPEPGPGQILVQVHACGVCRTDLHVVDGELPVLRPQVIPGHEVVGTVVAAGSGADRFARGQRVGIPWLARTCGRCRFCLSHRENLCLEPLFTGYTVDGGYAEYTLADERYAFALPDSIDDAHAAPLLCAGLIGFRALGKAKGAQRLGLYGFGAAAHILCQIAVGQGRDVFAFTRAGDSEGQSFARTLGASWAGGSDQRPPEPLDAAILFAPVGDLVVEALRSVDRGGIVVCAGIHMSDIPAFPYELLWNERRVESVANLTRADGEAFFRQIQATPVRTEVTPYPLNAANQALSDLRRGAVHGAAVLLP